MRRELDRLSAQGEPIAVIDVPLLYEAGMQATADTVICVTAGEETRLKRIAERSGLTRGQALARIQLQQDMEKTEALADYVLSTDGSTQENKQNALRLWRQITEKNEA